MIALLVAVVGGVWGTTIFAKVQTAGGFDAPDSQSQHEASLATSAFGRDAGDVVVLYSSQTLTAASPAFRSAVTSRLAALPHGQAESYATYWSTGSRQFVSASGHQTYAVIEMAGGTDTARQDSYDAIKTQLSAPGLRTQVGGVVPTNETIDQQVTASITRAEGLSFPILLILLLVIFGSLTAACLPLAIGGLGILGSFTALRLLTIFTGVSVFSLNITTILGLGLGIDYGLFLVGRFREELHRQDSVEDAVARTVATAGRTVAVSGVTVAIVLASLMLFPELFLRSMGYGGVATVLVDMLAALIVLPALLAVLGPKVNSLRIRRSVQRPPAAEGTGGWYRLAHSVMRRPVLYAVPIVVVLLGLASPFLKVVWGGVDATVLPAAATPRIVTEALNTDFPGNPTAPIEALVQFRGPVTGSAGRAAGLTAYVSRLDHVPGVTGAQLTGIHGDIARIDMTYGPGPYTPQARAIAGHVRDVAAPPGATAQVGGQTAALADELSSLGQTLPWMALAVVLATFLLMFLAFGSLILPLQAIVMNVLSLGAMFGVVTWDLPGWPPVRAAGLHPERDDQSHHPDPDVRDHVRAVHGLPGVLALADPRELRHHRRQHQGDRVRPAAHRRRDHQRRAAAGRRDRPVLPVQHHLHQAAGRRHDRRPDPRRHAGADAPRTRGHAAGRRRELVGTRSAAPLLRPAWHPRRRRSRARRSPGSRTRACRYLMNCGRSQGHELRAEPRSGQIPRARRRLTCQGGMPM